jgi:hypothetical protein
MKTVETVKLRQLRKTLATSENFGNLGKPLTNVVSNENENDEIIYLSTRKGRPNDFLVSSETVIGIEIFRCDHGTPGPLRGHQNAKMSFPPRAVFS